MYEKNKKTPSRLTRISLTSEIMRVRACASALKSASSPSKLKVKAKKCVYCFST